MPAPVAVHAVLPGKVQAVPGALLGGWKMLYCSIPAAVPPSIWRCVPETWAPLSIPIVRPVAPLEQATLICPVAFKAAVALAPIGSYAANASAEEVLMEQFCETDADTGILVLADAANTADEEAISAIEIDN
jgi:hypothetical protein